MLERRGCVNRAGGMPRALHRLTPVVILRSLSALREFLCLVLFHTALHWNLGWRSWQRNKYTEDNLHRIWGCIPTTFQIGFNFFYLECITLAGVKLVSAVRIAVGFACVPFLERESLTLLRKIRNMPGIPRKEAFVSLLSLYGSEDKWFGPQLCITAVFMTSGRFLLSSQTLMSKYIIAIVMSESLFVRHIWNADRFLEILHLLLLFRWIAANSDSALVSFSLFLHHLTGLYNLCRDLFLSLHCELLSVL